MIEKITALQQGVEQASNKYAELQKSMETERLAFKQEQQSLEARIVDLTTAAANVDHDSSARDNEIQAKDRQLQVRTVQSVRQVALIYPPAGHTKEVRGCHQSPC